MSAILELRTTLRRASLENARSLIKRDKIKRSAEWSGPSTSAEDDYIESEGFDRFADWYLGENKEATPDTKGRFRYPFTDDFKTISINGLNAIRTRSAQNDETDIFEEAGRLRELIDERGDFSSPEATRITFQVDGAAVDRATGTISGVSIIEGGEARGHRMMISERSLAAVGELLEGKILPAYISHHGAQSDRLMEEVGAFSDFYRDDDKIRAGKFEALPSFRDHEPERFDRLFDLADKMPSTFGISIVFEGSLFWETDEDDVPFDGFSERPEGAEFDLPTINPSRIFSADYVDTPAATASLFTENPPTNMNDQPISESMNASTTTELDESASADLQRRRAAEAAEEAKPQPAPAEEPKAKKKKKKLEEEPEAEAVTEETPPAEEATEESEPAETTEAEPEAAEVETAELASPELLGMALEEYRSRIGERDVLIADQTERINELTIENRALRRALGGTEELAAEGEAEEATPEDAKAEAIDNYLKANPTHNRVTAILEIGKHNPQIFNN